MVPPPQSYDAAPPPEGATTVGAVASHWRSSSVSSVASAADRGGTALGPVDLHSPPPGVGLPLDRHHEVDHALGAWHLRLAPVPSSTAFGAITVELPRGRGCSAEDHPAVLARSHEPASQ